MSGPARYDAVARLLHWLIVTLIVAQYAIGWTMPDVHRDTQPVGLIAAHLIVGAALLAAMACRVLWRVTHRPPPDDLSPVMRTLSGATHVALYALLVAVPLLGWINASSRAWSVTLLGIVPLPALSAAGSGFGHAMGDVHGILAWVLFGGICLHVAAALAHRFVLRDGVMQRMMPW
ncbi:cytochrome b [Burkholderia sp. Bp9017]|uniref:Cytochrome b n=1 Tax=Burkholderia anthina TaxID=179879 RepID=A0A7T7AK43_9BURK|nr:MULTISPECIES: cytochrome b [Burkholderia]MBY4867847.1 cytochrome b [Burkholderia anthina]QQK05478.1 cytochrome b [Burkholderia anthina]RQZ27645.1 cytochrome b [Burkholderia sp. Bp9017]RQZ35475.1 cytochrome b [Burkholderia sp. Bp9016]